MKIKLDGRKADNHYVAYSFQNRAYFIKRGLTKRTVLRELYHHLIYVNDLDMTGTREERAAQKRASLQEMHEGICGKRLTLRRAS